MELIIDELIEGAKRARGLAVVIDVFRAFSLECYLFAAGAERILAVGSEEKARALKEKEPDAVLIGERRGRIIPGFDYGNSPSQLAGCPLSGRTVIHTTSAGTQGLVGAMGADEILTGALVNAPAVASYIKKRAPERVCLIPMGVGGAISSPEDVLCARWIASLTGCAPVPGYPPVTDLKKELELLRFTDQGAKFFREDLKDVFPPEDFEMCTVTGCFDFVIRAEALPGEGGDVLAMSRLALQKEEL